MPVIKQTIGCNEDVTFIEFGVGDLACSLAEYEKNCPNAMVFNQVEPGEIGRKIPSYIDKEVGDVENVKVVMKFLNSQSVEVVIKALSVLKTEMKKNERKVMTGNQ